MREIFNLRLPFGSYHVDRALDEVTHHGFNVTPDIANFRELRGFDLDKRRTRELREAACYFGFAYAGRSDKDDVVGRDLLPDCLWRALAPPAIPECDRH